MRYAIALVAPLALLLAAGAGAQDDDEDEGPAWGSEWAGELANRASVGLNGVLTAPADPMMFTLQGDEVFEDLWQPQVTGRVVGFFAGVFQMPYRMLTGGFDFAFSWVPYLQMVSPIPRFKLLPWALHDDE